jgi:hypothetical protein
MEFPLRGKRPITPEENKFTKRLELGAFLLLEYFTEKRDDRQNQ